MASSHEEDKRHHRTPIETWYCARPARYCSGPWRTRPSLVQQMQRFDDERQLAETIDMSSVNYLTSLLHTRQIHQRCSGMAAHSTRKPLFIWTRDAHDDGADSDSEGFPASLGAGSVAATRRPTTTRSVSRTQLSYSLSNVVVVAYKTRTKTTGGSPEWRFCTTGTCVVMRLNNARDYEIYEHAVLLAVWKARRRNQTIEHFDLVLTKNDLVVARASKQRLATYHNLFAAQSGVNTSEYSLDSDVIIVSTATWLFRDF